jgi:hypothetical protein
MRKYKVESDELSKDIKQLHKSSLKWLLHSAYDFHLIIHSNDDQLHNMMLL